MIIDHDVWFSGRYTRYKVNKFICQYYGYIAESLYFNDFIPQIPTLVFTNAKSYYGKIIKYGNDYPKIRLSHWNILNPFWDYDDFLLEITDTICYELAHMIFWEHGEKHTEFTNAIKEYISANLEVYELEFKLGIKHNAV